MGALNSRSPALYAGRESQPVEDTVMKQTTSLERNPRTIINWDLFATLAGFWEDSAMENIDEEYDRLVEHLHDCAKKAESFKTTRRRNEELTSELARLCKEAIKEDLKESRAEVLAEAAEARKNIRYARRDFDSRNTRMTALRNPKGTTIASRRGMEIIIYDFYSDLYDYHVHLPPHHLRKEGYSRGSPVRNMTCYYVDGEDGLYVVDEKKTIYDLHSDLFDSNVQSSPHYLREDGHVIPEVLQSEVRHAIMSSLCKDSRKSNFRAPEEPSASTHQHLGEAFHTLPVGMQGSKTAEDKQDKSCIRREIQMTSTIVADLLTARRLALYKSDP
ncbi:hypothetical protein RB195_024007 [Necator americanus]|uniref:Uncharacterized protein n=1 Tax=Necator americanus TaxID=51031 RepID=A0ABR1ELJ6_NECAM